MPKHSAEAIGRRYDAITPGLDRLIEIGLEHRGHPSSIGLIRELCINSAAKNPVIRFHIPPQYTSAILEILQDSSFKYMLGPKYVPGGGVTYPDEEGIEFRAEVLELFGFEWIAEWVTQKKE